MFQISRSKISKITQPLMAWRMLSNLWINKEPQNALCFLSSSWIRLQLATLVEWDGESRLTIEIREAGIWTLIYRQALLTHRHYCQEIYSSTSGTADYCRNKQQYDRVDPHNTGQCVYRLGYNGTHETSLSPGSPSLELALVPRTARIECMLLSSDWQWQVDEWKAQILPRIVYLA